MSKILFVFLLLLINKINDLEIKENDLKINIIDNDMNRANFAFSLVDEKKFFYIITGENQTPNNTIYEKSFRRTILKYDINSHILVDKYSYNSSYPFEISKSVLVGKNSQYLLTITKKSIEIFNWNKLIEFENEIINITGRQELIKIDSYYYNTYIQEMIEDNQIKHYAFIRKFELIDEKSPSIKIIYKTEPIQISISLSIFSCATTNDNLYNLCVYFSENSYFTISVYDLNLNLIQTEKEESLTKIETNELFMKILYFKNDNKFIIIYNVNDETIRLRYFKYINGVFINLLSPIIDTKEQYIEIEGTQKSNISYNNDISLAGEDKIIKISVSDNDIIISIIQFYEHDTLLSIKIYEIENNEQSLYDSNRNPIINMIKNSVIICLNTYDNRPITGYFFLNYPNSKDLNLFKNSFLVKDLINMENTIYNTNLKLKILEIPDNFIFVIKNETSNYYEIKLGDILELDKEIILRQYKIKEGNTIFKFKAFVEGNDLGFSDYKIYPSNRDTPQLNDIYLEGREGHVNINFDECLEGYYKLEDNLNTCTNKKPNGYFLDVNEKIYKKCSSPCFDCSGPYISFNEMNCINCLENYFITEDTYSCYDFVPINYIKENYTLKRCHPLCTECIKPSKNDSNMNCLQCEYGYFLKTDTHNCIKPDEYKKREKKNLSKMKSDFLLLFVFILIFAVLTTLGISLTFLFKHKNERKIEEQKDEEENQKINEISSMAIN